MLFDNGQEEIHCQTPLIPSEEIAIQKLVFDTIIGDFISVFYCNLDTDTIIEVKKSPVFKLEGGESKGCLSKMIKDSVVLIDEEFVQPWLEFANAERVRRILACENRTEFVYSSHITGEQRWVKATIYVENKADGVPVDFVLTYSNVGEMQIERERANTDKENAKERYNFLINVAHELRTPLTLIIGPLRRLLTQNSLSEEDSAQLSRIFRQAENISTLLNTVLTANRLEEGWSKLDCSPVNLNKWISDIADEFSEEAISHGMPLNLLLDPYINLVSMDPILCKVVLSNILSNGIRHNTPGTPLEISSSWGKDRKFVHISVRDYGTGISEANSETLFRRFYSKTEDKKGFGIGLAYSKTIVDAHGGTMGAYNNTDGPGATFWFELPSDQVNKNALVTSTDFYDPLDSSNVAESENLGNKTVLYAEDNKDLRDYVSLELSEVCGNVFTAKNGKYAMSLLSSNKIDIVITDVMMPEMDGLELCHLMKTDSNYKKIPVVMLSAKTDAESIRKGFDCKADYYMDKPFDIDRLISVLNAFFKD